MASSALSIQVLNKIASFYSIAISFESLFYLRSNFKSYKRWFWRLGKVCKVDYSSSSITFIIIILCRPHLVIVIDLAVFLLLQLLLSLTTSPLLTPFPPLLITTQLTNRLALAVHNYKPQRKISAGELIIFLRRPISSIHSLLIVVSRWIISGIVRLSPARHYSSSSSSLLFSTMRKRD